MFASIFTQIRGDPRHGERAEMIMLLAAPLAASLALAGCSLLRRWRSRWFFSWRCAPWSSENSRGCRGLIVSLSQTPKPVKNQRQSGWPHIATRHKSLRRFVQIVRILLVLSAIALGGAAVFASTRSRPVLILGVAVLLAALWIAQMFWRQLLEFERTFRKELTKESAPSGHGT